MEEDRQRLMYVWCCRCHWVEVGNSSSLGFLGGVKKRQSSSSSVWRFGGKVGHVTTWSATGCVGCSTEFTQWPRRSGRQFEHFWFAFLHEQFLQLPLALHRQQTGSILQSSSWKNRSNRRLKFTYHHSKLQLSAVRGECARTSLVGTVQYVVSARVRCWWALCSTVIFGLFRIPVRPYPCTCRRVSEHVRMFEFKSCM